MKKFKALALILIFGVLTVHFSCSGSSVGDTVGDTIIVRETSSIPTVDTGGIDIISSPSGSISPGKSIPVGTPSAAGCMAIKFFRLLIIDMLKQVELSKCFIKKAQESVAAFSIPEIKSDTVASYGYYQFTPSTHSFEITGIKGFRVRLANVETKTTNTLKIDTCQTSDGKTFSHSNQYSVKGNLDTHTWQGSSVAHNIPTSPTYFNGASFEILMNSANNLREKFSWDNVTSASITGYREKNPATTDGITTFDDVADITFEHIHKDASLGVTKQSLTGAYNQTENSIGSSLYAAYTSAVGASHISHYNGYGTYETTQAFDSSATDPKTIATDDVSFYDDVLNATPPSYDIADNVRQAVAFSTAWDCEAPAGKTFTSIDADGFNYLECEKMVTELKNPDDTTIYQCFGGETLADVYNVTPSSPTCPGATRYILEGTGPAYSAGSGTSLIGFIYQNGYCSGASVGAHECVDGCYADPATGSIILYNCNTCTYSFVPAPRVEIPK